jgi:hypothetical protein
LDSHCHRGGIIVLDSYCVCFRKLNFFLPFFFFFFFFLQEVSGDDDTVDAGERMTEVDEGVAERQEMVLETTNDVNSKDTPVHKGDSGGIMANKTLGTVVSDEAILAMADEAVHETAPIMADEVFGIFVNFYYDQVWSKCFRLCVLLLLLSSV